MTACRLAWILHSRLQRQETDSKTMFRSRAAQTTILAAGSALALITATAGDRAHGEGNLDASYMISFARIPVGEITATAVFGQSEYAMSARARAGGVLKALLVDGEASFSTQGTIKDGHPVSTTFTSKIVSNTETSDVTMVLDEGNVKELAAAPPPSSDRVPVANYNRQGIVDPLTALLFSAAGPGQANGVPSAQFFAAARDQKRARRWT